LGRAFSFRRNGKREIKKYIGLINLLVNKAYFMDFSWFAWYNYGYTFIERMLLMLSKEIYWQARRDLAGKTVHLLLLEYLWPLVKDVDFETVQSLKVMRPNHDLLIHAKNPNSHKLTSCEQRKLVNTGVSVPYSHHTIRRTLSALGLGLPSKYSFSKTSFSVCKKKKRKK